MQYFNLGRSGLKVSPICLGTMMFGGQTNEATSKRIVDRARDAGINFIDTADAYNEGRSEEVTGGAIAAERTHGSWLPRLPIHGVQGRTGGASRGSGSCKRPRPACAGSGPTTSTFITSTRRIIRRRCLKPYKPLATSCGKARSATSAFRTIARGGSPRSAGCATRPASAVP